MLKISQGEREYLIQGVEKGLRNDGRGVLQQRPFSLTVGSLGQANGSCSLQLAGTDVLVGIKFEIVEPDQDRPSEGRLEIKVECCPSASPEFEGRGAADLNAELELSLRRLLLSPGALSLQKLCIVPGQYCWQLFVDALVLDSDGNLFDALSMACRAALADAKLPKLNILSEGNTVEIQISDDPSEMEMLDVSTVPVNVTLTKIGSQFVVDPCLEEELCQSTRLTVAVNSKGNTLAIQKGGRGGILPTTLQVMLQTARKIGVEMITSLDQAIDQDREILKSN